MRIAVLSDIHGNYVALEAVLDDLKHQQVDQIVCLGDAIQGGPQPAEVAAKLRELGCPMIMGNADDWLLKGVDSEAEPVSEARRAQMEDVRNWQLSRLSADDLAFISSFQPTFRLALDEKFSLLCYHGSPQSFDHVILPQTPEDEVRQYLNPEQHTIYTGGHTHMQFVRHLGRTFHFNPGSIGFAYRHDQPEDQFRPDPWAEYALLSVNQGLLSLEFRRVHFDVKRLIEVYRSSGRPHSESALAQYQSYILEEQLEYYRARAEEYDQSVGGIGSASAVQSEDSSAPADAEWQQIVSALHALSPAGDVLELACGTGIWTQELLKISRSITALDGSPEMLRLNQAKIGGEAAVRYQCADLFSWEPEQQYDMVFFAFWLSHVPPTHLSTFINKVFRATKTGGRVFIVDEPKGGIRLSGVNEQDVYQQRTLQDGRSFEIVKIYYDPHQLQEELRKCGFQIEAVMVGNAFFYLSALRTG
ncbi:metallophosphoesterase family protein [Kamptonema cortianum]|nr:metallophosphoesterase family protein [Oscillatoria laete-virens]MDK3157348.1 metallophosphoesterase family protein [Kamptonema cortianum]MDL5054897.1 metallophosphoesterase family protein [Oscillatoria laete-virens NRMC-F 0139]